MTQFCDDRDLLCLEPSLFERLGRPGQHLAGGSDGQLSLTSFGSESCDFQAAQLQPGMVLCITGVSPALCLDIVTVDSAHELTVSLLRGDPAGAPLPPPAPPNPDNLAFHVVSFAAQIQAVSHSLSERLRHAAEVAGVTAADFADSTQLRLAVAHGVLGTVFVARAEDASPADAHWAKAQHYRDEYRRLAPQLRLAVDADGDGQAEQTRTLGHINLRRV
jgi:hypothetical protein